MISDVLFEAVEQIDQYLNDPGYDDMYSGDLRKRIMSLREKMDAVRVALDTPPFIFGRMEDQESEE